MNSLLIERIAKRYTFLILISLLFLTKREKMQYIYNWNTMVRFFFSFPFPTLFLQIMPAKRSSNLKTNRLKIIETKKNLKVKQTNKYVIAKHKKK